MLKPQRKEERADLFILGPADDPLSPGDGEVGEYAIFLVLVSRVGLETFAFVEIPQFQRAVQGCSQNVFAVRRELHERHLKNDTNEQQGNSSSQ